MKSSFYNRIPALVLGVLSLVTIVITVWFFADYAAESNEGDTKGTSALLYWLYIVFTLTIAALLGGIVWSHFKKIR